MVGAADDAGDLFMSASRSYLVYIMRLWPAGDGRSVAWRAALENPHTGERHGFADLDTLFGFLQEETAAAAEVQVMATGRETGGDAEQVGCPATSIELYQLIGRALTDAGFRARLMEDPERAAREAGCALTAGQVAGLKASDLQGLAETINERLRPYLP